MKSAIFAGLLLFTIQVPVPRNDPNGIWEAETGTKFNLLLSGQELKVQIVEGSNPRFLKYEVNLKNQEEVNTYLGSGYFVARLQNGKECRFDTEWQLVVVSPERILGITTNITPDPETCEVKEKSQSQLNLVKK